MLQGDPTTPEHKINYSKSEHAARSTQCPHQPHDNLKIGARSTQHAVLQEHKTKVFKVFKGIQTLNTVQYRQAHVTRRPQDTRS